MSKEMAAAVPQVPTLCSPTVNGRYAKIEYEISVFSPTDVLEGKMRRAWSSALFLIFQKLYLGRALNHICSKPSIDELQRGEAEWFGCDFLVSDSALSQINAAHYRVSAPGDPAGGDPSSDDWYKSWWATLEDNQEFNHPGHEENAASLADYACKNYANQLAADRVAASFGMPTPGCSVLLATDLAVYVVIDFPDTVSPMFTNYRDPLSQTFGKMFTHTPYRGGVIFRSPWRTDNGETWRVHRTFDMHDLTFSWEEQSSGVRAFALAPSTPGQIRPDSPTGYAGRAIYRVSKTDGGSRILDLTDGSKWTIRDTAETEAKCELTPGWRVVPLQREQMQIVDSSCHSFEATFAGAW